jgi:hypothetical protein
MGVTEEEEESRGREIQVQDFPVRELHFMKTHRLEIKL